MSCEMKPHVKSYFDLILICLLIPLIVAFTNDISTLNPSIISSRAFCVQDLLGNSPGGIFQNKMTKAVFFTANASVVTQLTTLSNITFKEIKCLSKERVVLLAQNSSINIQQNSAQKQKNEDSSAQQKSLHSKISMKKISSQNFQKSSLKNIDTTITNTNIQNSTKKIIKKAIIKDPTENIVNSIFDNKLSQAFTWNQEKSLQNIDLTNRQSQQPRNKKIKLKVKFSNVYNNTNKIQQKQPIKAKSQKRHEEISNKNSLNELNFKLAKLNKVQRRALFDHQFGDFEEQKQNNQLAIQNRNKTKRNKNIVATFSYPTEDIKMRKRVKFLKIDSTMAKLRQFSKTQSQAKISFLIKQT